MKEKTATTPDQRGEHWEWLLLVERIGAKIVWGVPLTDDERRVWDEEVVSQGAEDDPPEDEVLSYEELAQMRAEDAHAETRHREIREQADACFRSGRWRIHKSRAVRKAPRARGAGRPKARTSSARRSSERSGDSGDPDEPEPLSSGRLCECNCGRDLKHLRRDARYATPSCRKRVQRDRDRANPDRALDRAVGRRLEAAAAVPLLRRCRCLGGPLLPDPDPEQDLVCLACGRHCGPVRLGRVNGYDARVRDLRRLMEADIFVRRPSPAREWRTRPSRSEAAKLRKTRRTRKAAA